MSPRRYNIALAILGRYTKGMEQRGGGPISILVDLFVLLAVMAGVAACVYFIVVMVNKGNQALPWLS